jgi:hypothetical protein
MPSDPGNHRVHTVLGDPLEIRDPIVTSHPSVSLLRKVLSGVGDKPDSDTGSLTRTRLLILLHPRWKSHTTCASENNLMLTETPAANTTVTIPSGTQL